MGPKESHAPAKEKAMADTNLILTIPQGVITATSLGVEGLATHRSPGSGKHFQGRKILADLSLKQGQPDFLFRDEGGWRDTMGDTRAALEAVTGGKRTKTALSSNGFSCTPVDALEKMYLVKTGGDVLELEKSADQIKFSSNECGEHMSPSDIALAAGCPEPAKRTPRLYLVICPLELVILSNLTPEEYAWYATHRPGKMFRQVVFTELKSDQPQLAAYSRYLDARSELQQDPKKKTKTVVSEDCMSQVAFESWVGYDHEDRAGLYVADRDQLDLWRFPAEIPRTWERASG